MKIAIIYTGYSPDLIGTVERELRAATEGHDLELLTFADSTIIAETVLNGRVVPPVAKRLMKMYMDAVVWGAEIVYNICSSIGEVADAAQDIFHTMDVPLIRIDEGMALAAVQSGRKIGILATLRTTLEPTMRLILRCAKAIGTEVELVEGLADGTYGKSGGEYEQALIETAQRHFGDVDIILLAQASMASCEGAISKATGKPVYSSPRYGAAAVAKAMEAHADK